jgi:CO/xanthine dehydrogenase Mo-binding subunit
MSEILKKEFSRKSFVKGGGALVVGFSLGGTALAGKAAAAGAPTAAGYNPSLTQLDSWLRVNADNTVNLMTSEVEVGQGISTGFLMVAAEELGVELKQMIHGTSVHDAAGNALNSRADTYVVPATGGIGGSQSTLRTSPKIRAAAVAARQELFKLASAKLGVPVSSLSVSKGVVSGGGKSVTYGELIGGKLFNVKLTKTALNPGEAPAKPIAQWTLMGTRAPRIDIPAKVTGRFTYAHNIRLPGMLHGRWVRPGQGPYLTDGFAKPLSIDADSIKHLKDVQIVHEGDFVGVVGPREYEVVQAAQQLKVKWAESPILPGHGNLWKHYREADTAGKMPARITDREGDFDKAFKSAAKTLSGTFKYPYTGHTPIGPACYIADYRANGGPDKDTVTLFCNTQNVQNQVTDLAATLKLKSPSQARVIYYEGSSSFGNGYPYFDIGEAAAILSRAAGKPVRLQLMRWDEQGWTRYGPAIMTDIRAGLDAKGNVVAYEGVQFLQAGTSLGATRTLLGEKTSAPGVASPNDENLAPMYKVAQTGWRLISKTVPQELGVFQNGALRAPAGPQTAFASEQMIDMLAELAGMDPVAFRRQNMRTDTYGEDWEGPRWTAVLDAAVALAQADGYVPHVPASKLESGNVVTGWGVAIGTHHQPYAATVANVSVNKKTGKITVNHLWGAQDSGIATNPGLIENQMVGNLIQATSKVLHEELRFSTKRVTSTDWVSYPILRFKDSPKVTTVVVNRKDRTPVGSGEPPIVPTGAAIANAVYDATGVRMTEAPLIPARVRGFLRNAGK